MDQPLPPLTISPADFKPAPVVCPGCGNDDRRLIEVGVGGSTLYCVVCSKVWEGSK